MKFLGIPFHFLIKRSDQLILAPQSKDQFLFLGFLPKTEKELEKILSSLVSFNYAIIFFIPALKTNFYLKKFKTFFSGREIVLAKEITKIHETFYREELDNFKLFKNKLKGEITVVISEKKTQQDTFNEVKIINKAKKFLKKYSLKDTVDLILETEKVNKKKIYQLCLKIKNEKNY